MRLYTIIDQLGAFINAIAQTMHQTNLVRIPVYGTQASVFFKSP